MRIEVFEGDNLLSDLDYADSLIRIGSHDGCSVRLPDMRISPQHITLFRQPDESWLVEATLVGPSTYLNGHHLKTPTRVGHGDELMVLEYRLKLRFDTIAKIEPVRPTVSEEVSRIRQYPLPSGSRVRKYDEDVTLSDRHRRMLSAFAFELRTRDVIPKIMDYTLSTLLREFDAKYAWLGVRHQDFGALEFMEGREKGGKTVGEPSLVETITYRCLERTQVILGTTTEHRGAPSFMALPLAGRRGRVGILYVESSPGQSAYSDDDFALLMMLGSLLTVQFEAIFEDLAKHQEAVAAGENSFLREIQARLDPVSVPQWEGFQLAVYCKSGLDQVGDVYDVMRLPNGMIALMVAHASGKQSRIAMAMTEVRAAFRVAGLHADPPHTVLRELDWIVQDPANPCTLDCGVVIVNPKTGVNQYCTAGDVGLFLLDSRGEPTPLSDASVPAVGASKQSLTSKIGQLAPSGCLVLCSPGCAKVSDAEGNVLGREGVMERFGDSIGPTATATLDDFVSDHARFFKDGRVSDDITILVLRRAEG